MATETMTIVVRDDREGGAPAGTRQPHAGRGKIAQDFAFHGNSAANRLRNSTIMGRTTVRPGQLGTGTRGLGREGASTSVSGIAR
jgi:hypothetical protein